MQMFVNGSIKMNLLKEAVQQNSSIVEGIFQFLSYKLGGNFRWLPLFYRNSWKVRIQTSVRKVPFGVNSPAKECQINLLGFAWANNKNKIKASIHAMSLDKSWLPLLTLLILQKMAEDFSTHY